TIKINALTGSIPKVTGINTATAVAGPNPGNIPTTVPKNPPIKTQRRFIGCNAVDNPSIKLLISIPIYLPPYGSLTSNNCENVYQAIPEKITVTKICCRHL